MSNDILDISILGREYQVSCPQNERAALLKAVDFLDQRMNELAVKTRSNGERLAVMTALNLAHELLSMTLPDDFDVGEFRGRMRSMEASLDAVLAREGDGI